MRTMNFFGLVYIAVIIALLIGWIMNVIKIFGLEWAVISGEHVIRVIGAFIVPIGGVMGWF